MLACAESNFSYFKFEYLRENEFLRKSILGAQMGSINAKKLKSKISWHCPFKWITIKWCQLSLLLLSPCNVTMIPAPCDVTLRWFQLSLLWPAPCDVTLKWYQLSLLFLSPSDVTTNADPNHNNHTCLKMRVNAPYCRPLELYKHEWTICQGQ